MSRLDPLDSHHDEYRELVRAFERSPEQGFDRVAFAIQVLRVLRIPHTRVAVFTSRRLHVDWGRELGASLDARWAMVGIPADASARSIVLALSEITRSERDLHGLPVAWAAAELIESAH